MGKVDNDIFIVQHGASRCAIVAVVSAERRESMYATIHQFLILDT